MCVISVAPYVSTDVHRTKTMSSNSLLRKNQTEHFHKYNSSKAGRARRKEPQMYHKALCLSSVIALLSNTSRKTSFCNWDCQEKETDEHPWQNYKK